VLRIKSEIKEKLPIATEYLKSIGWKVDLVTMDHISKEFNEKIRKQGRRLYAG
jgi:predicted nucleotidyltransferase